MSDIKIVNLDRSSRHDLQHGGEQDTSASGAPIYFICEYLEKLHHDEETDEYYKFCKHKKIRIENVSEFCNMDCEEYGRCRTCAGFSAVRCQDCDIPRPER